MLKKLLTFGAFFIHFCLVKDLAFGQEVFNYDETKIPPYSLPDPLTDKNGKKITIPEEWEQLQRPYLLKLFEDHVYGKFPREKIKIRFKEVEKNENALNGKAKRRQVRIYFAESDAPSFMDLLLYVPKDANKQVPVFLGMNFMGNHTIHPDPQINLPVSWIKNDSLKGVFVNKATAQTRGIQSSRWMVEQLIDRGFGVATIYYGDLEPDHPEGWKIGIRAALKKELKIDESEWSAIGAWAWGLSKAMDYLEKDNWVNAGKVVLMGHSRLGKAALWAGANDTRFAMVISNNSGEGGAALARRRYGETVERINTSFPHWFSYNFKKYNQNVNALPVDQHMLLALIAPRPLYIASAEEDKWADPKGEFLSAQQALPVFRLLAGEPVEELPQMPSINSPIGNRVRYHIRSGKHDVTEYDWQQYLKFAEDHLGEK